MDVTVFLVQGLEAAGTAVIAGAVIYCFLLHLRFLGYGPKTDALRWKFGQLLLFGLQFKLAAAILKTILIREGEELGMFLLLLALRYLLGAAVKYNSGQRKANPGSR